MHVTNSVATLRMINFQKRHKIEETKKNDEHKSHEAEAEVTILKDVVKVCY